MRSVRHSSRRGPYFPLKKEELSDFLDYGETRARVEALARRSGVSLEMKLRAEALSSAFFDDEDF